MCGVLYREEFMGMAAKKYDGAVGSRIVELASLGYSLADSANLLNVHRNTLTRWIKKFDLTSRMASAETDLMRSTIKRGLKALSEGASSTETIRETIEDDGEGNIVKVTEKVRRLAPNEKAIQILAQRYAKEFSKSELEEIGKTLNISLNTSNMSIRELNAVPSPLGSIDISRKEELKLDPPTRDLSDDVGSVTNS